DVLPPRQLAVESEAELEERSRPAPDHDAAGGRIHDALDQAQERAFPGAVSTDDTHRFAARHFERNLPERFELVEVEPPLEPPDRVLLERSDALPRDAIAHRDLVEEDCGRRHQLWNANRSARLAK